MRKNTLLAAAMLAGLVALAGLSGCSREKIDWKSAEAADSVEGYDHFIARHPDSALVTQAHARIAQLNEERDWKRAIATDTAEGYRQFLAQHESGKWAEEARIRIENFALDGTSTGPARPAMDAAPAAATSSATAAAANSAAANPAARPVAIAPTPSNTPSGTAAAAPASTANTPNRAASGAPASASTSAHAATATPTRQPAAGSGSSPGTDQSFGIQLGAFRTRDAALKNWKELQVRYDADLHGLFARAVPVKQTSGQLFRLQAPVGPESRARAICASLTRKSQPCVVVLPQPQAATP